MQNLANPRFNTALYKLIMVNRFKEDWGGKPADEGSIDKPDPIKELLREVEEAQKSIADKVIKRAHAAGGN